MARRRRSFLWVAVIALFVLSIFGFYLILVPHNPVTMAFRAPISDSKGRVVTGPYPVRSDFRELHEHGITTVVSLLDPKIPYEKVLLQEERDNANHYGMKFMDFPMASVLGQQMGDYYMTDAKLAAKAIDSLKDEKIYLHCYLGVHRMNVVRAMLEQSGTQTGLYTIRQSERSNVSRLMDSAYLAYSSNNPVMAIHEINLIKNPDVPAYLLRGWSYYRVHNLPAASNDFRTAYTLRPTIADAANGLGYCFVRQNQLDSARFYFDKVLALDAQDPNAQAGLATIDYRIGKLDDAKNALRASLSKDPSNTDARDLLYRINTELAAKKPQD